MITELIVADIDIIERRLLDDSDLWEEDAERAKMLLTYIAGVHDMANAVRDAIKERGERGAE